jgi:LPXTG-motif cell wall-anchored protein
MSTTLVLVGIAVVLGALYVLKRNSRVKRHAR